MFTFPLYFTFYISLPTSVALSLFVIFFPFVWPVHSLLSCSTLSFSIHTCLAHFSVTVNWILYFHCSALSLPIEFAFSTLLPLPSTCQYLVSHNLYSTLSLFFSYYSPVFPSYSSLFFIPPLLSRSWAVWCWRCCLKISRSSSQQRCRWSGPNWWEQCTGMWQGPTQRWAGSRSPAQQCEEFWRRRGKRVAITRCSVTKVSQTWIRLTW